MSLVLISGITRVKGLLLKAFPNRGQLVKKHYIS